MVRRHPQVREQKRLAARLYALSIQLNSHEYRIDLRKHLRIIGLQDPALLVYVVLIEDAKVAVMLGIVASTSPRLEGTGALHAWLLVEIVSVKDEGFALGVEDAPKRLLRISVLCHVV